MNGVGVKNYKVEQMEEEPAKKRVKREETVLLIKEEFRVTTKNGTTVEGEVEGAPKEEERKDARDTRDEEGRRDAEGGNNVKSGAFAGKNKRRGQNKAKDRRSAAGGDEEPRMCFALAGGEQCLREKCKFSHDIEAFLASKPEDLPGNCPLMQEYGKCKYGLKCRFLGSHASVSFGGPPLEESAVIRNIVSRDQQQKVRKNQLDLTKSILFESLWREAHPTDAKKKGGGLDDVGPIEAEEEDTSVEGGAIATTIASSTAHSAKLEKFGLDTSEVRLRPQEKKKLDWRGKTYLAPLTRVGNLPFRRVCKDFGVDITCAEMSMSQALLDGLQNEWALMRRHKSEDIFGIQITGNHPVSFTKLCDGIQQTLEVDFVDINIGCPVEAITSKGCGSALMERRSRLREMIIGANYTLDCPVTVKIRTGVRDKTPIAHKLIPQFQSWGVAGITLHGRTKEQRYTKNADWDYISECSNLIDRSDAESYPFFFGNGDCLLPDDYFSKLKMNENIDGVMIGRGALIKPWIFEEIKRGQLWDISATERLDFLKNYANYALTHWGTDTMGINQSRTFLCEWLSFLHRYVPVGLIEVLPNNNPRMNLRPEKFKGRNELETLMASDRSEDWVKISELILGKAPESFSFIPKHKSSAYETNG